MLVFTLTWFTARRRLKTTGTDAVYSYPMEQDPHLAGLTVTLPHAPHVSRHTVDVVGHVERLAGVVDYRDCHGALEGDGVPNDDLAAVAPRASNVPLVAREVAGVVEPAVAGERGVGDARAVGADARRAVGAPQSILPGAAGQALPDGAGVVKEAVIRKVAPACNVAGHARDECRTE